MKERPHILLYLLIAAMVLFWSANYSIAKVALREIPPLLLCGLRVGVAGLVMIPVYWLQSGPATWSLRDLPLFLVLSLFGVTLNQLCFLIGLSRTSVVHSVLIISMTPILVLIIAAFMKQEHITVRKAAGMFIAIAGVGILHALPVDAAPSARPTLLGDLVVFLAALTFAAYTVIGKTATLRHSSITVNTFTYVGAAVALAPVTIYQARTFPFSGVSPAAWTTVVYMALFPSVICYLIYYYALAHISASRVAAFSYVQPVIATLIAVIALRERVTLPMVAGGVVIFCGVYLAERG